MRIIYGNHTEAFWGFEGAANAAAVLCTYRNILQIRILTTHTARNSPRLQKFRVQTAIRTDKFQYLVDVCGEQFLQFAIRKYVPDNRMSMAQLCKLGLFCRAQARRGLFLPFRRNFQFIVKNRCELARRLNIKFVSRVLKDSSGYISQFFSILLRQTLERLFIHAYAALIHFCDNGNKRFLYFLKHVPQPPRLAQFFLQHAARLAKLFGLRVIENLFLRRICHVRVKEPEHDRCFFQNNRIDIFCLLLPLNPGVPG